MRHPIFTPNPELLTDEVRIFHPGEPVATARAPLAIGTNGDVYCLPGPVPATAWQTLDHAVSIIRRITPWAVVYAGPALVFAHDDEGYPAREIIRRKDCDKDYTKAGGYSFGDEGLVALSMSCSGVTLVETAYHEAWHQIERILDKNILDEIDAYLFPFSWSSAYLDSMFERRARCFANWCMYYEEGLPARGLTTWIDEIFDQAGTGETAERWKQTMTAKRATKDQSR